MLTLNDVESKLWTINVVKYLHQQYIICSMH